MYSKTRAAASSPRPEQAAEILSVGRDKVYYLLRSGQLHSIKIGKLRRISGEWITEFVESGDTAGP